MRRVWLLGLLALLTCHVGICAEIAALRTVGVLGNTAGMSDRPTPYAFYTGIGLDAHGRIYLVGAPDGVVVCDQEGRCLAVVSLPDAGLTPRSLLARAGDNLFFTATNDGTRQSALYRIDTRLDTSLLRVQRVTMGAGHWRLSTTLDHLGRVIVGESDVAAGQYRVVAVAAQTGVTTPLFQLPHPPGATWPWMHSIQVDPDGALSIIHAGGVDWRGRYSILGARLGDALGGLILDNFRYYLSYEGSVRRTDLDGNAAPGDCGSSVAEIRMAAQVVRTGDRYFFAGRGGALEAAWSGTNFVYTRRIGGVYLLDLYDAGDALRGIAFTADGNFDVRHPITLPKTQPIGELLRIAGPLHGRPAETLVTAPEGIVLAYRTGGVDHLAYEGPAHLAYDIAVPQVTAIGQAAVLGTTLLLADPGSGTIWQRPLMDKTATFTPWRPGMPGVVGVAVSPAGVMLATPTTVLCVSPDGQREIWRCPEPYTGIRRIAATADACYVCDTAGQIVDQLDAKTGRVLARLGVRGEAGASLTHLSNPYAVAADVNGVYVADNGNGRVVVATTTLWQPEIARLPRETRAPLVAATLPITPPKAGRLSVNIFDTQDVTVRQLACAQPSADKVTWDGRDLYGKWATPGTYRYHGLIAPKLTLRYVGSVGQSGTPPYRTADGAGSWGGVWGDVMDVCPVSTAPDADILVLWAFEEGEGGLIRMSQEGQVRWKAHLDWWMEASQMAVACDTQDAYIVCASKMGRPEKTPDAARPMLWRVDLATGAKKLYAPAGQAQPMFGDYLTDERIVTDLAVHDGKVYLTAPAQHKLYVVDAHTGQQLHGWTIPEVSGVAFDAAGRLLVGSGRQVLVVNTDPAMARRLLPEGEVDTHPLLVDIGGPIWGLAAAPNGLLAVSVGGPRQQVIYLDGQGHEVRAMGKTGGRPLCGKMQPASLLNPVGLCVTGNGKLFVAEHAVPRRFTRWSPDGALERQFHGPYYFSGMFAVDDDHPEYIYADTHNDLIRYLFDYQTGQWEVEHYWSNAYAQAGIPIKWWARIRHREGKTYWCSGSGAIIELLEDRVRPVAAVYGGYVEQQADGNYTPRYYTKNTGLMGAWSDLNGDGKQEPEEWQVTATPVYPLKGGGPQQGWGAYFDEKFDLYMHDWSDNEVGGVWKIPASWQNGTPVYHWDKAVHAGLPRYHGLEHGASGARTAFAADGAVYAFNGGYNAANLPGVGHGHDWEFAQITKYDGASGRPLWFAGTRAAGYAAPGEQYCPTGAAGIIGDALFWTDENSLVHVWDVRHGLYRDTLLEDISRDPKPSPYTVWVELFNTRVLRHPQTGKVYLYAGSDAIHVYEVLGLEQPVTPFQGTITLTAAGLAAAQAAAAARQNTSVRELHIPKAKGPVVIDGDLREFITAPAAALALSPTAQGTVRALYDAANLYLAYDVKDASPWVNAGGDMTSLFKTGDTVDVWVGGSAGKREPSIGDVRVLFAPDNGKCQVVVYRPKVAQGAQPVSFRSPSGEVRMDKVELMTNVRTAASITSAGYHLEAAIPWTVLGLTPTTAGFGLDFSLNFSDPAGQRNVACLRWGRNGGIMVYDLPTEARFETETWGVGLLVP